MNESTPHRRSKSYDPKFKLIRTVDVREPLSHIQNPLRVMQLPFLGACHSMALFPWDYDSLETLWSGAMNQPEMRKGWECMINSMLGAIVVGGTDAIALWSSKNPAAGFCLRIPDDKTSVCILYFGRSSSIYDSEQQGQFRAIAWALSNEAPLEPLIVCSRGSILYVLNVNKKQVIGQLRGHGGVSHRVKRIHLTLD